MTHKYRPDIDGLRGLSIAWVMLYHAELLGLTGGFIGVDIFFVISGYLITSLIFRDIKTGDFSLLRFFERRIRRILPALVAVLLFCLPFATFWLLPTDRESFFESAIAASLFFSNFYFYYTKNYFSNTTELDPLIHTWSLSIEEQFYLFYPFLILLILRLKADPKRLLSAAAVVSLVIAGFLSENFPNAGFYMPFSRAWQLLIGACIAFLDSKSSPGANHSNHQDHYLIFRAAIGTASLLVLLLSAILLTGDSPFLFRTIIPTLAAATLIWQSPKSLVVFKLLSLRPLVFLGLISYSAYLWHQPVLAFVRHRFSVELDPTDSILAIGLALLLATASWRWIETPFRDANQLSRAKALRLIGLGSAFITIYSAGILWSGWAPYKNTAQIELQTQVDNDLRVAQGISGACNASNATRIGCGFNSNPEMLVWGDSNAMHLVNGLSASSENRLVWQATRPGCGPFLDIGPRRRSDSVTLPRLCLADSQIVQALAPSQATSLRLVVLSSSFWRYLDPNVQLISDDFDRAGDPRIALAEFRKTQAFFESLSLPIVVISPLPQTGGNIGRCIAQARLRGAPLTRCNFKTSAFSNAYKQTIRFLQSLETSGIPIIFLQDFLCTNDECIVSHEGRSLYADDSHLSKYGSEYLGKLLTEQLKQYETDE
jgi:peptidoglycan/LPS O-acetylase OafA/YrhL